MQYTWPSQPQMLAQSRQLLEILKQNGSADADALSFSTNFLLPDADVSDNCKNVFEGLTKEIGLADLKKTMFLVQLLDSFGKPSAGFFQGAVSWPGNFDQCLSLKSGNVSMRHCMMPFDLSYLQGMPPSIAQPIASIYSSSGRPGAWGVCMPSACSEEDVLSITNSIITNGVKKISAAVNATIQIVLLPLMNLKVDQGVCRSAEDEAPAMDVWMICFFVVMGLMGALMVTATAYDYFVVDLAVFAKTPGSWNRLEPTVDRSVKDMAISRKKPEGTSVEMGSIQTPAATIHGPQVLSTHHGQLNGGFVEEPSTPPPTYDELKEK